jgi:hypothetical protein
MRWYRPFEQSPVNHDFILGHAPSKDKRQALDDISRILEPCIKSLKKKVKFPHQ